MAEFDFKFPEEFFNQLNKLSNTDDLQEKMLRESAPLLEDSMKKHIKANILHESTGELVDSIKARAPRHNDRGWYVFVGPSGYSKEKIYYAKNKRGERTSRKYKLTNAAKAIWMEYGRSDQDAKPFLMKSTNDANAEVIDKMQQIFNEVVDNG